MSKIPKVIHYCWFSGEALPPSVEENMKSWKKYCPDYEIKQWNTKNFDMNINDFVREAYQSKKWAFVTDYARLYVLYHYGGIYMDSDVEVTANLDKFLVSPAFMGMETNRWISAGIIGSQAGNECIKAFLNYYIGKHFVRKDGRYNQITNAKIITYNILEEYGIRVKNTYQNIAGKLDIYPVDVFSPKDYITGRINCTDKTCAIHHFDGGWMNKQKNNTKNNHEVVMLTSKYLTIIELLNQWLIRIKEGFNLVDYFTKKGYQKIAIYGLTYLGERLHDEVKNSGINVAYIIDQNANEIYTNINILFPTDNLPEVDAVIVTAVYYYEDIKKQLMQKLNCPIINLMDIIYDL